MTKEEIENLVKNIIASSQSQPVSQTISSKPQENQITLSQDDFKKIIVGLKETIAKGQQTLKNLPGSGKWKADELAIACFLESGIDHTGLPEDNYDYDPVEDLRLQFENLDINQAKLARIIHAVLKSSRYKCSECSKTGHNSRNCPKNKKKRKSRRSNKSRFKKKAKINMGTIDSDSESGASSSDNESNSESNSESGSESDSENNLTETEIAKIINAVKSKKK